MHNIKDMFDKHPNRSGFNIQSLEECFRACFNCADYCTICADAALEDDHNDGLKRCVRLTLDCADVCEATGKLLLRATSGEWDVISYQLEACEKACTVCAEECYEQAEMHPYCRLTAEMCKTCSSRCKDMLNELSARF
jgi:hypothetical protein